MYRGAREAFDWQAEVGAYGSFRPLGLGRSLASLPDRTLTEVRVYTGVPTPDRDAQGHGAMQRRTQAWVAEAPDLVTLVTRPLRYQPGRGGTPREKGIDVQLAIDIVRLSLAGELDLLILASADSDLVPALEFVLAGCPTVEIETVAWDPVPGCATAAPIDVPGGSPRISRRQLPLTEFERFADKRNFLRPSPGPAPGQSGRRLPRPRS
jgi:hypothetical protein